MSNVIVIVTSVFKTVVFTGWAIAHALRIGKVGDLATPGCKTPKGIAAKLGVSNYVGDPTLSSKYGSDGVAWVISAHA